MPNDRTIVGSAFKAEVGWGGKILECSRGQNDYGQIFQDQSSDDTRERLHEDRCWLWEGCDSADNRGRIGRACAFSERSDFRAWGGRVEKITGSIQAIYSH